MPRTRTHIPDLPAASSVAPTDTLIVEQPDGTKRATVAQAVQADLPPFNAPTARVVSFSTIPGNPFPWTYNNGTAGVGASLTNTVNGTAGVNIDGVAIQTADVVLMDAMATPSQNGLYIFTDGTSSTPAKFVRHPQMDTADEFNGAVVNVGDEGTAYGSTQWICLRVASRVVGATSVHFSRIQTTPAGQQGDVQLNAGSKLGVIGTGIGSAVYWSRNGNIEEFGCSHTNYAQRGDLGDGLFSNLAFGSLDDSIYGGTTFDPESGELDVIASGDVYVQGVLFDGSGGVFVGDDGNGNNYGLFSGGAAQLLQEVVGDLTGTGNTFIVDPTLQSNDQPLILYNAGDVVWMVDAAGRQRDNAVNVSADFNNRYLWAVNRAGQLVLDWSIDGPTSGALLSFDADDGSAYLFGSIKDQSGVISVDPNNRLQKDVSGNAMIDYSGGQGTAYLNFDSGEQNIGFTKPIANNVFNVVFDVNTQTIYGPNNGDDAMISWGSGEIRFNSYNLNDINEVFANTFNGAFNGDGSLISNLQWDNIENVPAFPPMNGSGQMQAALDMNGNQIENGVSGQIQFNRGADFNDRLNMNNNDIDSVGTIFANGFNGDGGDLTNLNGNGNMNGISFDGSNIYNLNGNGNLNGISFDGSSVYNISWGNINGTPMFDGGPWYMTSDLHMNGNTFYTNSIVDEGNSYVNFESTNGIWSNRYIENAYDFGTTSGFVDLNQNVEVYSIVLNGDTEFSLDQPPNFGQAGTMTLLITGDGASTISWAQTVSYGDAGDPGALAASVTIFSLLTVDGGSTWKCTYVGGF